MWTCLCDEKEFNLHSFSANVQMSKNTFCWLPSERQYSCLIWALLQLLISNHHSPPLSPHFLSLIAHSRYDYSWKIAHISYSLGHETALITKILSCNITTILGVSFLLCQLLVEWHHLVIIYDENEFNIYLFSINV